MKKPRATSGRAKRPTAIPVPARGEPRTRWRAWLVPPALALLAGGLVLLAVVLVGRATRAALSGRDRFTTPFAAVECEPPPGMDRAEFLSEVQYLSGMPDRLPLLGEGLGGRVAEALRQHPWVESVDRVQVASDRIRVRLTYRRPVLAVPVDGQLRAVDRHGVLLPPSAPTNGLPVFPGEARPPAGPAGTQWGDEAVERAARFAGGH